MSKNTINKVALKLSKKYSKHRKINENKSIGRGKRIVSFIVSSALVVLIIFSLVMCLSTFISRINKTPPSFFGYTFMQIQTGSMSSETVKIGENIYPSGHKPQENIIVHSVNTDSLNVGDKIAFYVSDSAFNCEALANSTEVVGVRETQLKTTFSQFFGFSTKSAKEASSNVPNIVFHHVAKIYEDSEGVRWFQTIGSANKGSVDNWLIREDYILGIYDDSKTGSVMLNVLYFLTSKLGLITTVLTPLFLLAILIIYDVIINAYLAKLELDVVEEKRKLTDDVCVKNKIGFRMSKKTKYKVLAQAEDDEKLVYLSLLWKDGSSSDALKKYCLKKRIRLYPVKRLLQLNRECEQMHKDGVKIDKIATYYVNTRAEIEKKQKDINRKLKVIHKKYKHNLKNMA